MKITIIRAFWDKTNPAEEPVAVGASLDVDDARALNLIGLGLAQAEPGETLVVSPEPTSSDVDPHPEAGHVAYDPRLDPTITPPAE